MMYVIFCLLGVIFCFGMLILSLIGIWYEKKNAGTVVTYHDIDDIKGEINIYHTSGKVESLVMYNSGTMVFNGVLTVELIMEDDGTVEIWEMNMNGRSLFDLVPSHYSWEDQVYYSLEWVEKNSKGAVSHDSIEYIHKMMRQIKVYNEYMIKGKMRWSFDAEGELQYDWVG